MRDLVKKATALITFAPPLEMAAISEQFLRVHNIYQQQFHHWSFSASRKKLVADFWIKRVCLHYFVVILLGLALRFPFLQSPYSLLVPVTTAAFFVALSLVIFNYGPVFYSDFLPKLDTIIAEQQKLAIQIEEVKKCKRTQFSIPTMVIIYYVFTKSSGMPAPAVNESSAERLNQLFGADKDKLKQNLSRLHKLSALSPKEKAEMLKGIDAARSFFEALDFSVASKWLDTLEDKLQRMR